MINLNVCKHRWTTVNRTFFDKLNWITIERCRRCQRVEQVSWTIQRENGKLETVCTRSKINPTQLDQKTGEISEDTQINANNQQTIPDSAC